MRLFTATLSRAFFLTLLTVCMAGGATAASAADAGEVTETFEARLETLDTSTAEGREELGTLVQKLRRSLSADNPLQGVSARSSSDCKTACELAIQASAQADLAEYWAGLADASSDPDCNSTYTTDALYYAQVGAFYADAAVGPACDGPGSADDAIDLLEDAEVRETHAWNNGYYSSIQGVDGCSESTNTATYASNAVVLLHNAAFSAANCS